MSTALRTDVVPGWSISDANVERLDLDLLARAYRFSAAAHEGQFRRNGDPFVTHCVEVARILADLQLDSITVAAGLIHDVVEDTAVAIEDVEREFGAEMAQIVDGLTKIGVLPLHSTEERQVENYRKLLVSIARDARVIIIKLADRLHNMRTLESLPEDKQRRISQETMDLYAPLAHRFGMAKMRWELEDLAFKFLEADDYRKLAKLVAAKRAERENLIRQLAEPLERMLKAAGIADVEVTGRAKHLWSIFRKMEKRERPYEEIYDLLAIRVLVNSVPDCYHTLGIIHDGWTPLQERIKDYIAQPKSNGYQSLHTTIFGPGRQLYEIQIRTRGCIARRRSARRALALQDGRRRRTSSTVTSSGSGRSSSCSSTPRIPRNSWSSSSSTSTRTRSSSSPRRGTSSSFPRGRHRSTSPSPSTPRSGCTAPAPR